MSATPGTRNWNSSEECQSVVLASGCQGQKQAKCLNCGNGLQQGCRSVTRKECPLHEIVHNRRVNVGIQLTSNPAVCEIEFGCLLSRVRDPSHQFWYALIRKLPIPNGTSGPTRTPSLEGFQGN